jgi:hypothetical protein
MPLALRVAITVVATAVLGALTYWLATIIPSAPPATCVETGCFCEAVGGTIPVQLQATLSSLAFAVAGIWVLLQPPAASRAMASRPVARTRLGKAHAMREILVRPCGGA